MKAEGTLSGTPLSGRRLLLARTAWIVVMLSTLAFFVAALPAYYRQLIQLSGPSIVNLMNANTAPEVLRAALTQAGISVGFFASYHVARDIIFGLVYFAIALVIVVRRSHDPTALLASLALIVVGFAASDAQSALDAPHTWGQGLYWFLRLGGSYLSAVTFYIFPNGQFVPRWSKWLALVFAVLVVVVPLWPGALFALESPAPNLLGPVLFGVPFCSIVLAQTYRYWRVSNLIERQQTKWVVFAVAVAIGGFFILTLFTGIVPVVQQIGLLVLIDSITNILFVFIPLSFGIAILRSHLWDIDILIRRTLVYGVLSALLASLYLGSIVVLQGVFTALTGAGRSELVTVISTLAIAALFVPLRNRVQAVIDRRFYRRKYDAVQTLAAFSTGLRDETDLERLTERVLDVVDETMQPASVDLWLKGRR